MCYKNQKWTHLLEVSHFIISTVKTHPENPGTRDFHISIYTFGNSYTDNLHELLH